MATSRLACLLLGMLLFLCIWSYHDAYDRFTWWLEAAPALVAVALLAAAWPRFRFTPFTYVFIALALAILLVGAHYTYPHVPLFNWLRDEWELSRNHYDRLGHVSQGFVPAIVARELLIRTSPLKSGKWLPAVVILSCLGISAAYELAEWIVGEATGTAADYFLGFQGDEWDTQKDMACALFGATLAMLLTPRFHDRALKKIIA